MLWSCSPSAGLPQGVTGPGRPIGDLPSPPPCGWSQGFITEPRTVGLQPMWRFLPALPMFTFSWSMLPTWPMVAMQLTGDVSQLAGGQTDQRVAAFFRHQLCHNASRTGKLCAFAGIKLHVVDKGTNRNVGQAAARCLAYDISIWAGHNGIAHLQAVGSDDIAFLAVLILKQGDMSGTVGVVFNGQNLCAVCRLYLS